MIYATTRYVVLTNIDDPCFPLDSVEHRSHYVIDGYTGFERILANR